MVTSGEKGDENFNTLPPSDQYFLLLSSALMLVLLTAERVGHVTAMPFIANRLRGYIVKGTLYDAALDQIGFRGPVAVAIESVKYIDHVLYTHD